MVFLNHALDFARHHVVAVILLAIYAGLALSSTRDKCTTYDEIACLTGGYSYWTLSDFRMQPENGHLPQRWATLPLLLTRPQFPTLDQPSWHDSDPWTFGEQFFYHSGNNPDALLFQGRAMIVLWGVALGAVVYGWSYRLFGKAGAIVSLIVYSFCPTMLAHGGLATTDLGAALFFTLALLCFWGVLHRVTFFTLLASCLAMAGLALAKFSAVLILPMAALLLLLRLLHRQPLEISLGRRWVVDYFDRRLLVLVGIAAAHLLMVGLVIWAAAGFRYSAFREFKEGRDKFYSGSRQTEVKEPGTVDAVLKNFQQRRLLPEFYLHGFQFTLASTQSRNAFLNGQYSLEGWPEFFPFCFVVKTPLPLFGVLLLGAAATWIRSKALVSPTCTRLEGLFQGAYRTAPLWILLVVYGIFAIRSQLNIGHRHLLPIYPALLILAGAAAYWLQTSPIWSGWTFPRFVHPILAFGTMALLAAFVMESLWTWPHYLAYFNQTVGGPRNGYKHLVDSSLDWGQDLPGLKRWLARQGLDEPGQQGVYLAYFGMGSPDHYGIHAAQMPRPIDRSQVVPPPRLRGGVYCVSATVLQTVYLAPTPGPWTPKYENLYQKMELLLKEFERTKDDPPLHEQLLRSTGLLTWADVFYFYESVRLAKLCAFLRQREPDDQVGHSILIYRLSDADLQKAFSAKP